jgi:hypothetical protein
MVDGGGSAGGRDSSGHHSMTLNKKRILLAVGEAVALAILVLIAAIFVMGTNPFFNKRGFFPRDQIDINSIQIDNCSQLYCSSHFLFNETDIQIPHIDSIEVGSCYNLTIFDHQLFIGNSDCAITLLNGIDWKTVDEFKNHTVVI